MRKYINIVEASLLNEYFVKPGEMPDSILELNVFQDLLDLKDDEMDDGRFPDTMSIDRIKQYQSAAENIATMIKQLPEFPLLPDMVSSVEDAWYDGSDAYEDPELLTGIYDNQLQVCKNIAQQIQELTSKTPAEIKKTVLKSIIDYIKTDYFIIYDIKILIESLISHGFDYPEFDVIVRHLDKK